MTASLARLQSTIEDDEADRRREARYRTREKARISSVRGDRAPALIADVSLHGCCIQCDADWLREGRFVSIELGRDSSLQAIVRWVRDGAAGMEFLHAVPANCQEWRDLMDSSFDS